MMKVNFKINFQLQELDKICPFGGVRTQIEIRFEHFMPRWKRKLDNAITA